MVSIANAEESPDGSQISCKFVTKLASELRVPEDVVVLPSDLTRLGLSKIINHLLALEPTRPFDFLVNGELIRLPLSKFLIAHDISAESILEIEYIFAVVPPQPKEQIPHDDWMGAVDFTYDGLILSGCYNGILSLYDGAGVAKASAAASSNPLTAVLGLPEKQGRLALAAAKDGSITLWGLPSASAEGDSAELSAVASYEGHTDAVDCVASSPEGGQFCSGSWDNSIRVWRTGASVAAAAGEASTSGGAEPPLRKQKVGTEGGAAAETRAIHVEQSRAELSGHSQAVSSVSWPDQDTLYSASWDHSIRKWSAGTGVHTDTLNTNKAIYCMAAGKDGNAVAFGGADSALRVWDPRSRKGEQLAVKAYFSHSNWIVDLAWSPTSEHQLITASHDKTLKLWDLRASVPLHTLTGSTDKVLSVAWSTSSNNIVSGGADCTLRIYAGM